MVGRWRGWELAQPQWLVGDPPKSAGCPTCPKHAVALRSGIQSQPRMTLANLSVQDFWKTNNKNKECKCSHINRSVQRDPAHLQSQGTERKVLGLTTHHCDSLCATTDESLFVHLLKIWSATLPSVNTPERRERGAEENSRIAVRGKKINWQPSANSSKPWKQGANKVLPRDKPSPWKSGAGVSKGRFCPPSQTTVVISPSPPVLWESLSHIQLYRLYLVSPLRCVLVPRGWGIISLWHVKHVPWL